MPLSELIKSEHSFLNTQHNCRDAITLMEDEMLQQMPLLDESTQQYIALIQYKDVLDWQDEQQLLVHTSLLNYKPAISANAHPFDALKVMRNNELAILPVLDKQQAYLGYLTREDLINYLGQQTAIEQEGAIIVVEVAQKDLSFAEIARICESEQVPIWSMHSYVLPESGRVEITIKTNSVHVSGLVQSIERHNLQVTAVFGDQSRDTDIEDRYDLLMTYLNM